MCARGSLCHDYVFERNVVILLEFSSPHPLLWGWGATPSTNGLHARATEAFVGIEKYLRLKNIPFVILRKGKVSVLIHIPQIFAYSP